ncbi:hypothetical protein [Parasitella parasitica]|uniref:Uncharacterized protein n=1 Tax=Parasitella parasitica TaxID=35722 RepID=A0A0B7NC33_9FUNG|nr:hypothetical protein [Parasitella parasitica]
MALLAPRMPSSACVGLLGVLDFNVVTFVMALLIFCSAESIGLALYSLVVLLFGLVVGVGLWVLWPRRRALLSLLGLVRDASPAAACARRSPGATAASAGLSSSRFVCPALPPAAVAVEPAVSAPATADVSGVLPAASAGVCPALPAPSCPVVLPVLSPVKPAATMESVAPAVVSVGDVLPPPADVVSLLSPSCSPVVMPAAASGADVGLVLCGVGGPACVVLPGDKIPVSVSPRVGKVAKKPFSRKLCRKIRHTDVASLGVKSPATPMSIDSCLDSFAADLPPPTAMEDVDASPCGNWVSAPAVSCVGVASAAAPVGDDFACSGPAAKSMAPGKNCVRSCCCARLRGSPAKRCARRGGRCWRQGGCVEAGAVPCLPAAGSISKPVSRVVAVRRVRRGAKELLSARAAGVTAAAKKARVDRAALAAHQETCAARVAAAAATANQEGIRRMSLDADMADPPVRRRPLRPSAAAATANEEGIGRMSLDADMADPPVRRLPLRPSAAAATANQEGMGRMSLDADMADPPVHRRPLRPSAAAPSALTSADARPVASAGPAPRPAGKASLSVLDASVLSRLAGVGKFPSKHPATEPAAASTNEQQAAIANRPKAIPRRRRP